MTTGGSTRGRWISALTSCQPTKRRRDKSQPAATPNGRLISVDESHRRRTAWLRFAAFLAVAAITLAVNYALATGREDSDSYRPEPVETADHLLGVTTSLGLDAVRSSECLSLSQAEDVVEFGPDLFLFTVTDGKSKAESVADCLRDGLAERVTLAPL